MAVFSCYLFKDISPEYFGDPIKSFYSTFKVFTVEGWYEIPEKILKNSSDVVSFFGKAYFIIILMTGGILGLSLVNSIFVDAMVSDNNDDLIEKVEALEKKVDFLIDELVKKKNAD
jgi:voltage-gated sodium channel